MFNHSFRLAAIFAWFIVLAVWTPVSAQDWSQWRGPNRDGVVATSAVPAAWPEALKPGWKLTVGVGHASPVVAGGRVIVFARQEEREVVTAVDLATGKIAWQEGYDAPYTVNPIAKVHGPGPKSTPVVANGKIYTLGIAEILSCYDVATGKLAWRKSFGDQYKSTSPDFGTAASPLVDRGLLIVHVGTSGQGALTAFDAATGDVKWRWTGDGPSYVSPIVVEFGGTRQVVTQSQSSIVSVAEDSGKPLWSIPFTTPYVQNIVTPLLYKDLLIFSGLNQGVMAVRPARKGDAWVAETVWRNTDVGMYMNSPILSGDLLFGLSHKNKGQFFCLEAGSGKTAWMGEPRQGDNAAMVLAGAFVVSLTSDGDLIVAKSGSGGLETLRKYKVAESATWAHPILIGRRLLIKDATTLALWTIE
jgi:outer membrane protein assembly factor BamB